MRGRGRGAEHRIVSFGCRRVPRARPAAARCIPHRRRGQSRANVDGAVGAGDGDFAIRGDKVGGRRLEQVRSGIEQLLAHRLRRQRRRTAGQDHTAAGIGAGATGHGGAVALHDAHILEPGAEMFGNDLGERGLQPLAMRGDAERRGDSAGGIDADDGRFGAGGDRHSGSDGDARADAGQFRITRNADADPAASGAALLLLRAQMIVTDRGASRIQAFHKARFVPNDTGSDFVGKFVGSERFRSRISLASTPIFAAAKSISRSMTKVEIGRPTPR